MKLFYFDSPIGNFGDDLNPWIWDKLLGDFSKYPKDKTFVGIGSVLDKRLNGNSENIIFGAGVRNIKSDLDIDKCEFFFVRGPLSSKALNDKPYITDSAYSLALLDDFNYQVVEKKYKCSIIPYFRHLDLINWDKLANQLGFKFINITDPVEKVIREIRESEKVISGAMHGAIVADIYRVPWQRLIFGKHGFETYETSTLKWQDWLLSIELSLEEIGGGLNVYSARNFDIRKKLSKSIIKSELRFKLKNNQKFYLSSGNIFEKRKEELNVSIQTFKEKYGQ